MIRSGLWFYFFHFLFLSFSPLWCFGIYLIGAIFVLDWFCYCSNITQPLDGRHPNPVRCMHLLFRMHFMDLFIVQVPVECLNFSHPLRSHLCQFTPNRLPARIPFHGWSINKIAKVWLCCMASAWLIWNVCIHFMPNCGNAGCSTVCSLYSQIFSNSLLLLLI